MAWEIEGTDQFADWYGGLTADEQRAVIAAVTVLERIGPGLGRPLVDTIAGSRHAKMKELRPAEATFGSCSRSTRAARPSCFWAATSAPAGKRGTARRSPKPTTCTTRTSAP